MCREVFGLTSYVAEIEALDNVVSTQTQTILYLEFRRLLDRASRWFLSTRPTNIDVVAEVEAVPRTGVRVRASGRGGGEGCGTTPAGEADQGAGEARRSRGRPPPRAASLLDLFSLLDVVDLAEELKLPVEEVAGRLLLRLGEVHHRRDAHAGQQAAA